MTLTRTQVHHHFRARTVEKEYMPMVDAEAVQMIRDFIVAPEHPMHHPKRFSNSILMSLGMQAGVLEFHQCAAGI